MDSLQVMQQSLCLSVHDLTQALQVVLTQGHNVFATILMVFDPAFFVFFAQKHQSKIVKVT